MDSAGQVPGTAVLVREDYEGIARLRLNRPSARNALSRELLDALYAELTAVTDDRSVRVVIIESAGPAFCAGHDLRELRALGGAEAYRSLFAQCSRVMRLITTIPQPVIAKVDGVATAAGCQLVAASDLAVASERARFATPGVNIGLFCSTPMVALSRNVGRKQAMEMLLLGEFVDATTALRLGLVNRVVPDGRIETETLELARAIVAKSPLTLRIGKEAFYRQLELGLRDAYDYASEVMTTNMLARDAEEGIDAFLEKRSPQWEGS
jgi:enoyl-CoA hydratase/carnithine racemase